MLSPSFPIQTFLLHLVLEKYTLKTQTPSCFLTNFHIFLNMKFFKTISFSCEAKSYIAFAAPSFCFIPTIHASWSVAPVFWPVLDAVKTNVFIWSLSCRYLSWFFLLPGPKVCLCLVCLYPIFLVCNCLKASVLHHLSILTNPFFSSIFIPFCAQRRL